MKVKQIIKLILLIGFIGLGAFERGYAQNSQDALLIDSIRQELYGQVEALIQQGTDISVRDENGRTALMWSAFKGRLRLVKQLSEQAADMNAKDLQGRTVLMYASIEGHEAIVAWLLEKGVDYDIQDHKGKTALMHAASHGHQETTHLLLESGANPHIQDHNGLNALQLIAFKNYPQIVALLQKFKNIPRKVTKTSQKTNLPRKRKIESKKSMITKMPLAQEPPEEIPIKTGQETLLIQAVIEGNQTLVENLVSNRTYIDARDPNGMSALMWAARYNHLGIAQILVKHKAKLDLKEYIYNWTAIMWAGRYGHVQMVQLLARQGANLQLTDKYNWTLLDIASAHHQRGVVRLFDQP